MATYDFDRFKGFRPQQGLPIMNVTLRELWQVNIKRFPSPTGVTYYECNAMLEHLNKQIVDRFRPQQGLPIMNHKE